MRKLVHITPMGRHHQAKQVPDKPEASRLYRQCRECIRSTFNRSVHYLDGTKKSLAPSGVARPKIGVSTSRNARSSRKLRMVLVTLCLSLRLSAIFCLLQDVQIVSTAEECLLDAERYLMLHAERCSSSMFLPEVQHSMSEPNFFAKFRTLFCW